MVKTVVWIFVACYLVALFGMYVFQRQLLYFPTPAPINNSDGGLSLPTDYGLVNVVVTEPGQTHGVIYFGGNAEDAFSSPDIMGPALEGFSSYYLNYPGYGGSEGQPSEASILAAANALYDYVAARHDSVSVVGRSLGTGAAVYLASTNQVRNTVLVSPYDSIESVAFRHYPIFPMSLMVKDKFDSLSRAPEVQGRVLIMMALWDRVIPPTHSQTLLDALSGLRPEVEKFKDADHNTIHMQPRFAYTINDFLKTGIE